MQLFCTIGSGLGVICVCLPPAQGLHRFCSGSAQGGQVVRSACAGLVRRSCAGLALHLRKYLHTTCAPEQTLCTYCAAIIGSQWATNSSMLATAKGHRDSLWVCDILVGVQKDVCWFVRLTLGIVGSWDSGWSIAR